jgi:transposase InsO family protein
MKREDPGRSAALIHRELELAGRLRRGEVSTSAIRRLLRRAGLSGPRMEIERPVRLRWQASRCGELWQGDALHGPSLFDSASGRPVRVKIFALLDDRSRLVPYLRADFHETQTAFLSVLLGAILRRGIPRAILLDNHGSFTGSDVAVASAKLGARLVFARPHDGPSKGKIERWWRTLRAHVLDRLDLAKVTTLDDLNVRLSSWVEAEYNQRPHSSLGGKTPLEVWEEDAEDIRWVEDPGSIEAAFTHSITRSVRLDSTCQIFGRTYEVPPEHRGRTVKISYSLLRPTQYWVLDASTRIPLREVDPESNSGRPRKATPEEKKKETDRSGFNPVEDFLRRLTRPQERKDGEDE